MPQPTDDIIVTLRIPGNWSDPEEIYSRLPRGCRIEGSSLFLEDGSEFECHAVKPDGQFADVFSSSCRVPPTTDEMDRIRNYKANTAIIGRGGSLESAYALLRAGAAIVKAGGAGVFIDNSALAHGGEFWLEMLADGSPDAISFAFVSIIHTKVEVFTIGLHVLGAPDVKMQSKDVSEQGKEVIEMIQYLCNGVKEIGDGHIIADEDGPLFRTKLVKSSLSPPGSPMYNPYGCLQLISFKDIAEQN